MKPYKLSRKWWLCSDAHNFTLCERQTCKDPETGESQEKFIAQKWFSSIEGALKEWGLTHIRETDEELTKLLKRTSKRLAEIKNELARILPE